MNITKLDIVPLRQAFPHEAHSFTIWLEANIEALSDRLDLELTVLEREKAVGSFNLDLYCEDRNGNKVIVENQLERTDHDHLGKLLTYLVNLEAKTAIWVTPEVRPEHERVIDWLNEWSGADYAFYLVRVEAIRIGDSPYAPLFTVLARPDTQTRQIGDTKKELAARETQQIEFWTQLLALSKGRTPLFSAVSPSDDSWLTTGAGRSGLAYLYLVRRDAASVEFSIDVGNAERNKAIYDALYAEADDINAQFGQPLEWHRNDTSRLSKVRYTIAGFGGLRTPETWPQLQAKMIDAMVRLEAAFRPRIARL